MLFKCLNWNNVVKLDSYKQAHRLTNKRHQEKNKVIKLTTKVKHYIGDWEVDLVIGKGHKGGFATLLNARADFTLCYLLPIKQLAVLMTLLSNYSCHLNAGLKH